MQMHKLQMPRKDCAKPFFEWAFARNGWGKKPKKTQSLKNMSFKEIGKKICSTFFQRLLHVLFVVTAGLIIFAETINVEFSFSGQ